MIKSNFMRIMMIASSLLIIVGVGLMYHEVTHPSDEEVINVHIEEGSIETIEFAQLSLVPGATADYLVRIKSEMAEHCELVMSFKETGESPLKNFAYVRIISGNNVLYDDLLATAFEEEQIVFNVDFDKNHNTELTVEYYMPIEIGNEAKNAEAFFELHISASNEEVIYGE